MPSPGSVGAALVEATGSLRSSGSPTPRLDAEVLLAHVTGRDRSWVLAHPDAGLGDAERAAFGDALRRRAAGEPVAYIRGFREWMSLRILTDARALIPRPETEVLAECAVREIAERLSSGASSVVAWEVATGSGAVALALALRFREEIVRGRVTLIASDISEDALALAAENLAAHDVADRVTLIPADLLEPAGASHPQPDVVIANVPYLSTEEVDAAAGWLGYEPRIALEAGPDGREILRRLLGQLPERSRPGATAVLEVALGQAAAVAELAPTGSATQAVADLAGVERVVIIRRADD